MFVADDLGGWLIGLVADAARKKLIRGDELDRALRASAATAIKRTGAELSPTNLSKRQQSSTRCFTARPEPCQSGKRQCSGACRQGSPVAWPYWTMQRSRGGRVRGRCARRPGNDHR